MLFSVTEINAFFTKFSFAHLYRENNSMDDDLAKWVVASLATLLAMSETQGDEVSYFVSFLYLVGWEVHIFLSVCIAFK